MKCRYKPQKPCFHASCDLIDCMGHVSCCPLLPNPSGRFTSRRVCFHLTLVQILALKRRGVAYVG